MSLLKALNYLDENPEVKIRRSAEEVRIFLGEDSVKIYLEEGRVEFFDIDKANERTLREKYYKKFPELRQLFLKLVEEGYDIQPQ
jgi:hypothetical protein